MSEQELVIEFRQRFTVKPPESIDDPQHAKGWFWNIYPEIGRDVLTTDQQDNYEIIHAGDRNE